VGLTGYLHCTTLPNFGQIRQVESRVWSTAAPTSATFRASDLTVHLGTHPTVLDCSLLTSGTAWYSRLTRFVGACRLHLQGEENYSKFVLKFWPWGRQNLYSKFARTVAGRQHAARDTVLCCPLRHFLTEPRRNAGVILRALSSLIIQTCITLLIHFVKCAKIGKHSWGCDCIYCKIFLLLSVYIYIYSDISANEDNSFRNHIR
jgi:hypothetical protein